MSAKYVLENAEELRKRLKKPQRYLAEMLGVTLRTYQNYLSGSTEPSHAALSLLRKFVNEYENISYIENEEDTQFEESQPQNPDQIQQNITHAKLISDIEILKVKLAAAEALLNEKNIRIAELLNGKEARIKEKDQRISELIAEKEARIKEKDERIQELLERIADQDKKISASMANPGHSKAARREKEVAGKR